MFEYTENNHFKFGYNGTEYNARKNKDDTFWSGYGPATRKVGTFKEECYRVARVIKEKADALSLPVDIMYSGTDLYVAEKPNNVVMRFNNILSTAGGDISADASMAFSAPESVAILPAWLNQ